MSDLGREVDEAYRKASLFLARQAKQQRGRAVLVASARHGEGTTTAVLNLAHHLKHAHGLRPLIIELGDHRRGLATLFDLDGAASFRAVLNGRPLQECVQYADTGIAVIPSGVGDGAEDTSRAPRLDRLREAIQEAEGLFDAVLIDAPPLSTNADAMMAGTIVPRLILVVAAGRSSSELLCRLREELRSDGVEIVAAILNRHRRFIPGWLYRWLSG